MEGLALHRIIYDILGSNVVPKEDLLKLISQDHPSTRTISFLRPMCMQQLESFLERNADHFMVENGMVCTNSAQLERGREKAVSYYLEILSTYIEPCHYINLRGHIGQADQDIQEFIETFYHEKDFLNFLLAHPDDFVVFDDDKVLEVEEMAERSVEFFRKCLEKFGEGLHFLDFRGHYTHEKYVRQYIQQYYPDDEFLYFLQDNDDVFYMEEGYVYLR